MFEIWTTQLALSATEWGKIKRRSGNCRSRPSHQKLLSASGYSTLKSQAQSSVYSYRVQVTNVLQIRYIASLNGSLQSSCYNVSRPHWTKGLVSLNSNSPVLNRVIRIIPCRNEPSEFDGLQSIKIRPCNLRSRTHFRRSGFVKMIRQTASGVLLHNTY